MTGHVSVGGGLPTWSALTCQVFSRRMGENAMAFQKVPNTVEITVVMQQNVEVITNTLHAEKATLYDLAEVQALALLVDSLVSFNLVPIMTVDSQYLRTEVRGLDSENDLFAENNTNAAIGADPSLGLPNNVTLSIKKASGFTGRSARGRWYICGVPSNNLASNENQLTQASADVWVAALEGIRAGIALSIWTPVIVSRFTNGLPRAEGVTFDWLTVVLVDRFVDSQRNRLTR